MKGRWIQKPTGTATAIFVHGILSSGDSAWKHKNGTYWPELLSGDEELAGLGVFEFTYKTGIFSGSYSLSDVVDALKEELRLERVLEKSHELIFVCHSMGGIVVRKYVVERQADLIERKIKVGLFLVASPSLGSGYANWLRPLIRLVGHSQADVLRFQQSNQWLNQLDKEFVNMKESGRIPIRGKELIEHRFILKKAFFVKQVVAPFSGARYFGERYKVAESDHFSIAKPENKSARQHLLLRDFIIKMLEHRPDTNITDQSIPFLEENIQNNLDQPSKEHRDLPVFTSELRGRGEELEILDEAWKDPSTKILTVVGWGGLGKTSLIAHWRDQLQFRTKTTPEVVYEWSFHKQGDAGEEESSDDFFHDALMRFDRNKYPSKFKTPEEKGQRLANLMGETRTLLILDGTEALQYRVGKLAGEIEDPALKALINEWFKNDSGLCLITTRLRVSNLATRENFGAPRMELTSLSVQAGTQLLRDSGVQGTEKELRQISSRFGGHALALKLLAGYLKVVFSSDASRWREVALLNRGSEKIRGAGHARRVLESYERWLEGRESMLAVLRLIGLYNRPADPDSLEELRSTPVIAGLTDAIIDDPEWNRAIEELEGLNLITSLRGPLGRTLDAHPIIREYYWEQLAKQPNLAREAHLRLFEHYSRKAPNQPQTLDEMMPLLFAIAHGCRAGEYDRALDVFWNRVRRGNERYLGRSLGAHGSELMALRNFIPGSQPVEYLDEKWNARLLGIIASDLRSLGRLREAGRPAEAAQSIAESIQDWLTAAIQAGNLCEFDITLGKLNDAMAHGQRGVELADKSGNMFLLIGNVSALIQAYRLAGENQLAQGQFEYAQSLWEKLDAPEEEYKKEFAYCDVTEFNFCSWLSSERRYDEIESRCRQVLENRRPYHSDLYVSLVRLSLASALYARDDHVKNEVFTLVDRAVEELEQAGVQQYLAFSLVLRSQINSSLNSSVVGEDLKRAALIAHRGQMRIVLTDITLQVARHELSGVLSREQGQEILDRASGRFSSSLSEFLKKPGEQALQDAKTLIQATGYHAGLEVFRQLTSKNA